MEIKRNFDLLYNLKENFNKDLALSGKKHGQWHSFSTNEYVEQVNAVSYGLLHLGIQRGDKVAIISYNRPEWNFSDFGASQLGAVTVPMYPTISENDFKHILNNSGAKLVVVENQEYYQKLANIRAEIPGVLHIYSFDQIEGVPHFSELISLGKNNPNPTEVERLKALVQPEDLMTLIYTSGTTGTPKGVMLSHNNIMSNVRASSKVCPVTNQHKVLSFLPLCHIFERMICYMYHYMGATIYYAESMETIGENLKEVQPFAFSTVPRLLEKVYDRIVAKGHELTGLKKSIFFWALELGLKYELNNANGPIYALKLKIADKLIFSKWREALGNNVGVIVSGSAPLQPRLARVFTAAGVNVLEGYGLTETSPVITVNRMEHSGRRFGSVGLTLEDVEIKIAEDGEVLCKGPNVMMGYYNLPEATREAIDEQGWFHTGDIGVIEDGKFLKITDRKKEVFKTSGGKYIAPQPMENKFKESPFIEQLMVIGEGEKHAAALIVPSWEFLEKHAERNGITLGSKADAVKNPQVLAIYQAEVDTYNKNYGNWETIKKFELIPGDWTVDGGEVTPTLKLKRKFIMQKYQALVDKIYRA